MKNGVLEWRRQQKSAADQPARNHKQGGKDRVAGRLTCIEFGIGVEGDLRVGGFALQIAANIAADAAHHAGNRNGLWLAAELALARFDEKSLMRGRIDHRHQVVARVAFF